MTEWTTRPYREGDGTLLAATITAGWRADGLDILMSTVEVEPELRRMDVDLKSGILVVEEPRPEGVPEGCVPGVGALGIREDPASGERIYQPRIVVHPAARPLGLERELARRLFAMAREHEARPDTSP